MTNHASLATPHTFEKGFDFFIVELIDYWHLTAKVRWHRSLNFFRFCFSPKHCASSHLNTISPISFGYPKCLRRGNIFSVSSHWYGLSYFIHIREWIKGFLVIADRFAMPSASTFGDHIFKNNFVDNTKDHKQRCKATSSRSNECINQRSLFRLCNNYHTGLDS